MLWPLRGIYTAVLHFNIHSHGHTLMMGANLAQYLAQRHTDIWTGQTGNGTADLPISGRPALPPEPQPKQTQFPA